MAKIYVGEEKKFAIELKADGFSMDDNDFEVEVMGPKNSVKGNKKNTLDEGLRIFNEQVTPAEGEPFNVWFGILDTSKLSGTGELKVIGTAFVPDANADDGIRKSMAVSTQLGNLANP